MEQTTFERGIEKGQRLLLAKMLTKHFGQLNESVLRRLASWPTENLPDLANALLTATSLRELGLED